MFIQDRIVNVYRLITDSADADKEQYDLAMEGLPMNIQPIAPEMEIVIGNGSIGRIFAAYTTASGIMSGMIITASGTTTTSGYKYVVTGVEDWSHPKLLPHYELQITKMDE